jgi:hypothetical protein
MNKIRERRITPVYCPHCKASFNLPEVTEPEREKIAEISRAGSPLQTIQRLRQLSGIGFRDAKAIELHLTDTRGICHRCKPPLPSSDANGVVCQKCKSFNLDW